MSGREWWLVLVAAVIVLVVLVLVGAAIEELEALDRGDDEGVDVAAQVLAALPAEVRAVVAKLIGEGRS